ncbi:MAG: hypothetical protein QOE90_2144 [Thermoplasmata archaeon]|jgi:hypothetical protein|nr:hypothetical protein [Thermoplasmata archaeon]
MTRSTTQTHARTSTLLALLALACASPALAATKESGIADSATLDVTITDATHATLRLSQTWEGTRAADMRQSLDAYFGNGDGRLSPDEVAKVTAAASHDLVNQTYPGILIDGQPSRVETASVTIDGTDTNDTNVALVLHHDVGLAIAMAGADNHTFALTPLWNGTYTLRLPAGLSFGDGSGTQTGGLGAGTQLVSTFGVASQAPAPATPASAPTPSSAAAPTPTPQEVSGPSPPKHRVPAPSAVALLGAIAGAAALAARRRRR